MNITEASDADKYNNTGYYLTPDLSQRLDLISHLLANTQLVPFVQAAEGCGKTRLVHHLAETLTERYSVFLIEGESGTGVKALRSQLCEATGAASHEVIDDEQLALQLKTLDERGKRLLFLVDDADQLPAETLTWLTELVITQQQTFISKCVIFATVDVLALPLAPVLLSTLKDSIQTLDIPHITPGQLPGFVASIDPLKSSVMDEHQYAALMKNSSGVIGKILWQLQYIDNSPAPRQEQDGLSSEKMKPLYVVAGILFVSALASVLIFQDEINQSINEKETSGAETQLEVINLPLPPPVVAVKKDLEVQRQETMPAREEPDMVPEELQPIVEQAAEKTVMETSTPREATVEIAESKNDASAVEAALEAENEMKLEAETGPEQETSQEQPENIDLPPPAATGLTEKVVSVDRPVETGAALDLHPAKSEPVIQEQPQKKGMIFKPLDWILNQPDKSYTLQLLAVSDEKGINRFLKLHDFQGNFIILKTKRNGEPWYALLFETYASRDEALNARKSLPKTYKSSSAWPRSILSIRQAMGSN